LSIFPQKDFIIYILPFAIFHPHFVIRILSSAFHHPHRPHFIICILSSAFFHPPSAAIRSSFYRDPNDSSVLIETTRAWKTKVSSYHLKLTIKNISLHYFTSDKTNLKTPAEKTTSNEYLRIDSKKRFNEKTVLLREQRYLIETHSQTETFCANINGLDLILFSWPARNANDIDGNWPGEYHHWRKPPQFCTKNNCSCTRNHYVVERLRLISLEISSNLKSKALMTC